MKIVEKNGDLIGYPTKEFSYKFQGYYKVDETNNVLMFYGVIYDSDVNLVNKDTGVTIEMPTPSPVLFTLPLKDKEISYKDKVTGEGKTFTQKSQPQYVIFCHLLGTTIGENVPFKAVLTTDINDGLCAIVQTGINPITGEKIPDIQNYQNLIIQKVNPLPLDSLPFENKLLQANSNGKGFQKTYVSETEKLRQRLTFIGENISEIPSQINEINRVNKAVNSTASDISVQEFLSLILNSRLY
jgi:hypothetical protein